MPLGEYESSLWVYELDKNRSQTELSSSTSLKQLFYTFLNFYICQASVRIPKFMKYNYLGLGSHYIFKPKSLIYFFITEHVSEE